MDAEQVQIGKQVLYSPSRGGPEFEGTVATEPWCLGHGTWVVHLKDMPPEYAEYTGRPKGVTTVKAAALTALREVSDET